ncbi:conserved hypothetical protein, partial [Listeria ivanovii FSL F6-596]
IYLILAYFSFQSPFVLTTADMFSHFNLSRLFYCSIIIHKV